MKGTNMTDNKHTPGSREEDLEYGYAVLKGERDVLLAALERIADGAPPTHADGRTAEQRMRDIARAAIAKTRGDK